MLNAYGLLPTTVQKHKSSKTNECATCKCCGLGDEDVIHMLLECPALYVQKTVLFKCQIDSVRLYRTRAMGRNF